MSRLPGPLDFNPSFYHQEALHEAELRRKERAVRDAHHGTSATHNVASKPQRHWSLWPRVWSRSSESSR